MKIAVKLADVKAKDLKHMSLLELIGMIPPDTTDAQIKAADDYFARFSVQGEDDKCIACGDYKWIFRWGIAHGEGNCVECGWPGRAYHYDVGPLKGRFVAVLQYHPDEVHDRNHNASALDIEEKGE